MASSTLLTCTAERGVGRMSIALLATLIGVLTSACGGGGGGGSSSPASPPPPPPPPPPAPALLKITDANAPDVAFTTFSSAELVLQNAGLMVSAAAALQTDGGPTIEIPCDTGQIVVALVDSDSDSALSTGDTVTVTYDQCENIDGEFSLVIDEIDTTGDLLDSLTGSIEMSLTLGDQSFTVVLEGSQYLQFSIFGDTIRWLSTDAQLETSGDADEFAISDGVVDKRTNVKKSLYSVSISGTGSYLGDEFEVTTSESFEGPLGAYPDLGILEIVGENSALEISHGDESATELARYRIDSTGNGDFGAESFLPWDNLVFGPLFDIEQSTEEPPVEPPPDEPPTGEPPVVSDLKGRQVDLGAGVFEALADDARGRIYFSIPDLNEIAIVDSDSLLVTARAYIGPSPHGLWLSNDGATLYAALNQAGAVGALDLDTLAVETLVVAGELGSARAYDVAEASPGELFVSANPSSSGFAWIAKIDRNSNDVVSRVANERIIRTNPELFVGQNKRWLYIGDRESLYKIDADDPKGPIVLQDPFGSSFAAFNLSLSPDETLIYMWSGNILRTASFIENGRIGTGVPVPLSNGTEVYVRTSDSVLEIYSATTYELLDSLTTDCDPVEGYVMGLVPLDVPGQWLLVGGNGFCAVDLNNPDSPPSTDGSSVPPGAAETISINEVQTFLPDIGADLELDALNQRLYVSFPTNGTIVSYATDTLATIDTFDVGGHPVGIDFGPSGNELAIAFRDTGMLGFLDVDSGFLETFDISEALGDSRTYDVAYVADDSIFVSADASSTGFSWIVKTTRADAAAAIRVADDRIIRAHPELVADPSAMRLYIGEGFSPNSIYVLDIAQPQAPIIAEDVHGSVSGTNRMSLSPDGAALALTSGQIIRTADITQQGRVGSGVVSFSADGQWIVAAQGAGDLHYYSAATYLETRILDSNCAVGTADRLVEVPAADSWALLGDDVLCVLPMPGSSLASKIAPSQSERLVPSYRCDDDCLMRRFASPSLLDPERRRTLSRRR